MELDAPRIKRNIQKMIDLGAPETEIDGYVASEGTTAEALRAAPRAMPSVAAEQGPAAPPAPPTYHGTEPQAVNAPSASSMPVTHAGIQGAGRGLADIAGMPGDLLYGAGNILLSGADWASRKAGGPELSYRLPSPSQTFANVASEAAKPVFEAQDPEAMSRQERLAYNVNRFGTQSAVTAPGLALAAGSRAAALAAPKAAPRLGDTLLRPYMGGGTGTTLAGDLAAGVGAGGAVSALDETPLKDHPALQALAPMAGGVAGVSTLAGLRGAGRGIGALAGRPFGANLDKSLTVPDETGLASYPRARASDIAAREIQNRMALSPEAAGGFLQENRAALSNYMPDTMPPAFYMTEDPGLAEFSKQLAPGGGKELLRQQKFQSGVRDVLDQTVPPEASLAALVQRAQAEADARMAAAEGQAATAEGRVGRVADIRREQATPLKTAPEQVAASQELHRSIEEPYKAERAAKNEAFNALDPTRTKMVSAEPVIAAAQDVRARINTLAPEGRQQPSEFLAKIEALSPAAGGTGQAALGDLVDVRKYLSTEWEKAQAAGSFDLADSIASLRKSINNVIGDAPDAAAANEQYKAWAQKYKPNRTDEMARFTQEINRGGQPPPSQTGKRFLQPDQPEKSAALGRTLAGNPDAVAATEKYLWANLAESKAVDPKTGVLKLRELAIWRNKNSANIDLVPGLREQLDAMIGKAQQGEQVAGTAAERLRGAEAGVKRTQTEIDKGALGLVLGSDADKAVHAVMGAPGRSGRLLNELIDLTANDPQARNGLKAAVHRYIVDQATTTASEKMRPGDTRGPVSPAKLTTIFSEHEAELAKIFSPEEMNGLRAGYRALQLNSAERLRAGVGSDTFEKLQTFDKLMQSPLGRGIDAALRLKFGMLKGGGMTALIRRQMGGMKDTVLEEAGRLVKRANEDPEVLLLLMGRKTPIGSPAWNARLNTWLGAASGAREMNDENQRKPDARSR